MSDDELQATWDKVEAAAAEVYLKQLTGEGQNSNSLQAARDVLDWRLSSKRPDGAGSFIVQSRG